MALLTLTTWASSLGDGPLPRKTFYTDGRHLHDPNGNKSSCAALTSLCWTIGISRQATNWPISSKREQTPSEFNGTSIMEMLNVRLMPLPIWMLS